MATVSRFSAVAKIGPLEFSGFIAWLIWLVLHLVYLIGFKTKITTLLSWTVTFLSTRRGQLTITDQQAFARTRLEQLAELAAEAQRRGGQLASRCPPSLETVPDSESAVCLLSAPRDSAAAPDRGRPPGRLASVMVTNHSC